MSSCVMSSPDRDQVAGGFKQEKSVQAIKYAPFEAFLAKLEELDAYSHQACHQFPKLEKFLLAAQIRNCLHDMTRQAIIAFKRQQKSSALFELDVQLMTLKHMVRKANRLGYINLKKFEVWSRHIIELGAMLGGWIKHDKSKIG